MRRKEVFRILVMGWAAVLLTACTDRWEGERSKVTEREGIPVELSIDSRAVTGGLKYDLYVFRKETSGSDYLLEQSVSLNADGQDRLRLMNDDLRNHTYRFLFLATSDNDPEIAVKSKDGTEVTAGSTAWSDLTVVAEKDSLTAGNYYGILDRDGSELLKTGSIEGVLTRLTGQFVFEFYRVGPDGISAPTDIVSPDVLSVLDRVYRIDLLYTGLTQAVRFGTGNMPAAVLPAENTVARRISLQTGNDLRVGIPQGILEALAVKGAVRFKGEYGLPAAGTVRIKMTFYFYDTTPRCGEPDHSHDASCYPQRTLLLNLPEEASSAGLSMKADYFTVNKGGIRYDRIIDLENNSGVKLEIDWKND